MRPPSSKADLVLQLVELGYSPIPRRLDRHPLVRWSSYHTTSPTWIELFGDWFVLWDEAESIGLVTGRPHNIVVVDADDDEAWGWCLHNLPAVRGVKTARGGHLHFRHPDLGIVGNRSGKTAVSPAPGVRLDVKGLGGMATAPYSRHPTGCLYEPLGDWTRPVPELPVLPGLIRQFAEDRPPVRVPPPPRIAGRDPVRAIESYLRKVGGVPREGQHSDDAVFRAAAWAKRNVPDLSEGAFVSVIRGERSEFSERWIASKWRSAGMGCRVSGVRAGG